MRTRKLLKLFVHVLLPAFAILVLLSKATKAMIEALPYYSSSVPQIAGIVLMTGLWLAFAYCFSVLFTIANRDY